MTPPFTGQNTITNMDWGKSHSFAEFVDTQLLDLQSRFGMAMWFLTRQRGENWLLLNVRGQGYDLERGDVLLWRDSICHRRVRDQGPLICPDVGAEPLYRDAPITRQLPIGAYLGMPLRDQDGQLFGTLCALDPAPQPQLDQSPVREALRRQCHLLETALMWNLAGLDQQRITAFFEEQSRDPDTDLLDQVGWMRILDQERQRCQDYGLDAAVLRLHGAALTPEQRGLVADSIAALIRHQDMAAYLGHDQFAVLLTDNHNGHAEQTRQRLLDALNAKGVLMRCDAEPLSLVRGQMQPEVLLDGAMH
ncbi:GAF domain-containing protein [Alloalcanivorax gelatiniphagus]|uniref:GAF domain-containing protein n=2 Tax=Alloalcanivorax gelatiniphagus TaxID=1194167 RepID=A0ABY2XRM5_9GAMM|nr:GAF domain-containing protein [Alloalcanivorax gelatiniphagus]